MTRVPQALRQPVNERARWRCEYCQTQQIVVVEMEIDHIVPVSAGGATTMENLCLSCISCNAAKSVHQDGIDPETGNSVKLYHPRQDRWEDHFQWSSDFSTLIGLTPCGRATIDRLEINSPDRVRLRRRWVEVGLHPPID